MAAGRCSAVRLLISRGPAEGAAERRGGEYVGGSRAAGRVVFAGYAEVGALDWAGAWHGWALHQVDLHGRVAIVEIVSRLSACTSPGFGGDNKGLLSETVPCGRQTIRRGDNARRAGG